MTALEAHHCSEAREFFRVPLEAAVRHALTVCAKYSSNRGNSNGPVSAVFLSPSPSQLASLLSQHAINDRLVNGFWPMQSECFEIRLLLNLQIGDASKQKM